MLLDAPRVARDFLILFREIDGIDAERTAVFMSDAAVRRAPNAPPPPFLFRAPNKNQRSSTGE